MTSQQRIVVGVDGSPSSLEAARWAVEQAELTGSRVEAVIGWQPTTAAGLDFYVGAIDWEELASSVLDDAVKEVDPTGEKIAKRVLPGHPSQVLVQASADADLLVVGSRGHGGFVGLLVGSVSEYLIAHAKCPVLVVRQQKAAVAA